MLLCLFDNNSLIPNDFDLGEPVGNVRDALLRAGFKALNYLYNLRRYSFSKKQILELKDESKSVHYDFSVLWRARQLLFPKKNMTNYEGKL